MTKIKSILSFGFLKNIFKSVSHHKKLSSVILIVLILIAYILYPKGGSPVLTQKVATSDVIKSVSVTGDIFAEKSVNLAFQIGGTLSFLGVKEGDSVNAFQTIATLDQRTAQKNLDVALLNYNEQRSTFDTTQTNNQNRTPDQALNNQMKIILQNNQYDLNKSIDSVDLLDLARQESILTTPIAGIVTRADALASGVNVTPATIFTVTDPKSLNFRMEVDEADIGLIKIGQDVNVSLDSFPNKTLKLKVTKIDFVSHKSSSGGNTFYVYTALPMGDLYRVGMNGNADIIIDQRKNVLSISSSSIFSDNYVYVKRQNKFVKTKVSLGLQSDTNLEVLSGVSNGDTVALDPNSVPQNLISK
jgi:RND family efflux transporter MFP subunit